MTAVTTREDPDDKDRIALYTAMQRIRRFEERCVELYSAGDIRGFMHLCVGEEAVAVGVLAALGTEDAVVSTYRDHGHALARGVTLMANSALGLALVISFGVLSLVLPGTAS
jgi:pyruvate dehydrogenase E1 component subunit alpha